MSEINVYADNAATTCVDGRVIEKMLPYMTRIYGNPAQSHAFGEAALAAAEQARADIAECIGCVPEEIYFTSGGTESDNIAVKGFSLQGKTAVTSLTEHKAVLQPFHSLEKNGVNVRYLRPRGDGLITVNAMMDAVRSGCAFASIMTVNNETGAVQDIPALCDIVHSHGAIFHTDAVQAVGHIPVNVKETGADLVSASAHKFGGPKGTGFLYIKKHTAVSPLILGGGQEKGLRSGTLNVPGVVGMAEALKLAVSDIGRSQTVLSSLRDALLSRLASGGADFIVNAAGYPGIISLSFNGVSGEALMHYLDMKGVAVATGAACDGRGTKVSHVLAAMNVAENYAKGTVRISFSADNTAAQAVYIADMILGYLASVK